MKKLLFLIVVLFLGVLVGFIFIGTTTSSYSKNSVEKTYPYSIEKTHDVILNVLDKPKYRKEIQRIRVFSEKPLYWTEYYNEKDSFRMGVIYETPTQIIIGSKQSKYLFNSKYTYNLKAVSTQSTAVEIVEETHYANNWAKLFFALNGNDLNLKAEHKNLEDGLKFLSHD